MASCIKISNDANSKVIIVFTFLYENVKGPPLIIFELFSRQVANSARDRIKFDGG